MTKNPARRPVRTIPAWRPSRRQLLRGLAAGVPVAIGLPTLDAMLDGNARAYADGTALPRRFGTWFFAAGVHQGWQPGGGTLELQGPFAPLAAHANAIAMVSGLSCPSFGDPSTNRHIMGAAAQLTGHPPAGGAMTAPSLDQVMADVLDDAPRRAMIVGVTGYGSGESGTGWHAISHSGPNAPNVAQLDPRAVYQDMFAGASRRPAASTTASCAWPTSTRVGRTSSISRAASARTTACVSRATSTACARSRRRSRPSAPRSRATPTASPTVSKTGWSTTPRPRSRSTP
ncbi:MAG: DUF1552 domain-containing protein [Deltaproteobacteria bacterium]|nr:DUF1552 domain-containing protein [Deltaproteobacteria bacterium]MBK8715650.1 DUF1552 domain-containing protein [Deltaproteobacteria bacterium]